MKTSKEKFDSFCERIIKLFNEMSGIYVVLASTCFMINLGLKKDIPVYMVTLFIVLAVLLSIVTLFGHIKGLGKLYSDFAEYGWRWSVLVIIVAPVLPLAPTMTVIALTYSLLS